MKRHLISASAAALGLAGLLNSQALATGPALDSNHSAWDENAYYGSFGGPLPAGIVEGSTGFSTIGDYSGRTLPLATRDITSNYVDSTPLTTINTGLYSGTDVNLYEFQITNPATFSASVASSTLVLTLFNSTGGAIAASIGGASDAITDASAGVTTPAGLYWIAIGDAGRYAQNAEAQNIFGLTGTAGVYTPAAGITDLTLSTDPDVAWSMTDGTALLANTSFLAPSSTITLGGSSFAAVPEPTSLCLLGTLSLGLLARRRKAVGTHV